jgi:hypothetical protein
VFGRDGQIRGGRQILAPLRWQILPNHLANVKGCGLSEVAQFANPLTQGREDLWFEDFPSCTFVPLVVDGFSPHSKTATTDLSG